MINIKDLESCFMEALESIESAEITLEVVSVRSCECFEGITTAELQKKVEEYITWNSETFLMLKDCYIGLVHRKYYLFGGGAEITLHINLDSLFNRAKAVLYIIENDE